MPFITWSWRNSPPALTDSGYDRCRAGLNHLAFHVGDGAELDELVVAAADHGWTLMFADRHPRAGGPELTCTPARRAADRRRVMDARRRRARELGIVPGSHAPGPHNSITDVAGVRVGHTTVLDGPGIRTGVTAIVPDKVDRAGGELPAGFFVGNGYGKLIGATQIAELGVIETPILLTGTLSAFRAADALVSYMLRLPGNEEVLSVNPVVGETNDGFLSDIRARPVTEEHVLAAVSDARGGPVAEGSVGAGTGTAALGFKAGIGTSSRVVRLSGSGLCVLGVLVQANFSGTLSVLGVSIDPAVALAGVSPERRAPDGPGVPGVPGVPDGPDGPDGPGVPSRPTVRDWSGVSDGDGIQEGNSCMIVVAVDRALDARQLTRVARRAIFGMARTGSEFAGSSGDYAIAFATEDGASAADSSLGPVFAAVQEAVEEAVLNSVFMATTTVGYLGHTKHAVPPEYVVRACRDAGVLRS